MKVRVVVVMVATLFLSTCGVEEDSEIKFEVRKEKTPGEMEGEESHYARYIFEHQDHYDVEAVVKLTTVDDVPSMLYIKVLTPPVTGQAVERISLHANRVGFAGKSPVGDTYTGEWDSGGCCGIMTFIPSSDPTVIFRGTQLSSLSAEEWEQLSGDTNEGENGGDDGSTVPSGSVLQIVGAEQIFASGEKTAKSFTLRNTGNSTLRWRLAADMRVDWLQVQKKNRDYTEIIQSDEIIAGELEAGAETKIRLRLSDIYKTDYGKPYFRTGIVKVVADSMGLVIPVMLSLKISKLQLQGLDLLGFIDLDMKTSSRKLYINNIGEEAFIGYHYFPVATAHKDVSDAMHRAALQKFRDLVTIEQKQEKVAGVMHSYLEITADTEKLAMSQQRIFLSQQFIIYSSGDSKGITGCNMVGGEPVQSTGRVVLLDDNEDDVTQWTTRDCRLFTIRVRDQ